jgi:carboxyl-terminal processing protease
MPLPFSRRAALAAAALCALLPAAAGCALEPLPEPLDCSIAGKNARLYDLMKDVYLWYPEVPDVDPNDYESPEALLRDLAYAPLDRWSFILPKEVQTAYYGGGRIRGLGFRWKYDSDGDVRFSYIYPGSPAGDAGLKRGDKVVAVDGRTIAEIEEDNLWEKVIGEDKEGVEVAFAVEDEAGQVNNIALEKRWFGLTTTPVVKTLNVGSKSVGYLFFNGFIDTSEADLSTAFATFKANKVDDLILDLRYNGGGSHDIAQLLGNLVRAPESRIDVFSILLHNDKHASTWDHATFFDPHELSLDLPRVFVLVSDLSASASEVFINALRPYMEVKLIGSTTHGKPVGMYATEHCDVIMNPVTVRALNGSGEGDFYDGFAPDCPADDLLTAELGSETESTLAEALHLIEAGSCSASAAPDGALVKPASPRKEIPLRGFRRETGVF